MTPKTRKIILYATAIAVVGILILVFVFGVQDAMATFAALVTAAFGGWFANRRDKKRQDDLEEVHDAQDTVEAGRERLADIAEDTARERVEVAEEIANLDPEDKARLGDDLLGDG